MCSIIKKTLGSEARRLISVSVFLKIPPSLLFLLWYPHVSSGLLPTSPSMGHLLGDSTVSPKQKIVEADVLGLQAQLCVVLALGPAVIGFISLSLRFPTCRMEAELFGASWDSGSAVLQKTRSG